MQTAKKNNGTKKKRYVRYRPKLQIEPLGRIYATYSDEDIMRIADELVAWAETEDEKNPHWKISQFRNSYKPKKIPRPTYEKWVQTRPYFREAHTTAMEILGDRREMAAAFGKAPWQFIVKTLHNYDIDWLTAAKFWAELQRDPNASKYTNEQMVEMLMQVMAQVKPTGKVPDKKEDGI